MATGEDLKSIYSVDMETKLHLINDDPPEVLMVRFQLFSSGPKCAKLLIHLEFHVMIPLLFNWLNCDYELCAMIIHHGSDMGTGHFSSLTYHQQRQLWLFADNDKLSWLKQGGIPTACKAKTSSRYLKCNHFPYSTCYFSEDVFLLYCNDS